MGPRSSDARAAEAAFVALRDDLEAALLDCPSGRKLMARGYAADVYLAAQLDVPDAVAVRLVDGAYKSSQTIVQSNTAPRYSSRRPVSPS